MSEDHIAASFLHGVNEVDFDHTRRLEAAWKAYNGTGALPLAASEDGIDDNVRINLARALVRKGVSWLFGADRELPFVVEETQSEAASDNDSGPLDRLNEIWPAEARAITLNHLGVNGGVTGHTFCKLLDDNTVTVWDPTNVDVTYDGDDYEDVWEYTNTWTVAGDEHGADGEPEVRRERVIKDDSEQFWEIVTERSTSSGSAWEVIDQEFWTYEWSPVFHCQNLPIPNEFWGESDLESDVIELADAIQMIAGYMKKMTRHRGHPIPYVAGEAAAKLQAIDVSIGKLLKIPGAARVGQLEALDLGAIVTLYDKLWEAWHYVTRTPAMAFGVMNVSNVAQDTVEFAYASAVEKTWDKRLTYGPMLMQLTRRMLERDGAGKDHRPRPQWGPVVPRSSNAEATAAESDLRMGIVSKQTISEQRGYDWDIEQERIAEERKATAEQMANAFNAGNVDDPGNPFGGGGDREDEDE